MAIVSHPSPNKYDPKLLASRQTVSFTKEVREDGKIDENPGVGTYNVEKELNGTLGNMGLKLKKLAQFVNPSPLEYSPKEDLTRPRAPKSITFHSDRVDFSKSITTA